MHKILFLLKVNIAKTYQNIQMEMILVEDQLTYCEETFYYILIQLKDSIV